MSAQDAARCAEKTEHSNHRASALLGALKIAIAFEAGRALCGLLWRALP